MSDSDDTEVLLLIPPDFYMINETLSEFNCSFDVDGVHDIIEKTINRFAQMSSSYNYNCLPAKQRSELESINARLNQIEKNNSVSDASTVSNWPAAGKCTRPPFETPEARSYSPRKNFAHSTPKTLDRANRIPAIREDDGILSEIDNFLEDNTKKRDTWERKTVRSLDFACDRSSHNKEIKYAEKQYPSLQNTVPETNLQIASYDYRKPEDNYELISLSEIWGREKTNDHFLIQEERMRRQHCEKTIQDLQAKLLDCQQKLSVAVEIDKSKDAAIKKANDEHLNLRTIIKKLEEQVTMLEERNVIANQQLLVENDELKTRSEVFEGELSKAVKLASNLQDKNELLEDKISSLMRASNEVGDIYKKQIQDMEIRLSNSQRSEELLTEEVIDLKKRIAKYDTESENIVKMKNAHERQVELLEGELEILKQQKQSSYDKYREEKNRADILEKQKLSLNAMINELELKEANLLKELESQRSSLKIHYQKQLEQVVAQKLQEFQAQLDAVEKKLKEEAKQRERVLAERAIKQIEMINEKNEQEIHLLQEKQGEEIELYRIQINNASKTIEELEEKLTVYKSRRAEIAEKLHKVMEAQWQKALEILTSPQMKDSFTSINADKYDPEKLDGVSRDKDGISENNSFETPQRNKRHDPSAITDKLHAYIEMLLEKSPRDLHNLDEILKMPKNRSTECAKSGAGHPNHDKSMTKNSTKRPWK